MPSEKTIPAFVCFEMDCGELIEKGLLALIQQICISMKVADSLCVKKISCNPQCCFIPNKCPDSN